MVKNLLEIYFRDNTLVKQQLDSFNRFIDVGLQEVADRNNDIKTSVAGFEFKFGRVRIEPPRFYEVKGGYRQILPVEARLRNLSYTAPVFLEIIPICNGVERPVYSDVFIGEIPIMVKSKLCYLSSMSKDELITNGEDPNDPGGYFIINGSERVLVSIEDLVPNRLLVTKESTGEIIAKIFSTRQGFRARCVVKRNNDGIFKIEFPTTPSDLPMIQVLRVLGFDKDLDIINVFSENNMIKNDILLNIETEESTNQSEAMEILSKRLSPGQQQEYRLSRLETLIDSYLLPHLGTEKKDRKKKAEYIVHMAKKAIMVAYKKTAPDDKDHYANKRVKLAGDLMYELFNYALQFLVKDMVYQASRANARGRRLQVHTLVRQDAMADRIRYAMATGNWIAGQTGVSQLLDRTSFLSTLSHLRRVISPLSKKHPHFKARDLHGTHWGKICPSETPEGPSCSLVKNLSIMAEVSIGADETEILTILNNFGVCTTAATALTHACTFDESKGKCKGECENKTSKNVKNASVYVNGKFIGKYNKPEDLVKRLREKRRTNELNYQINIYYNKHTHEIFINSERGRVRRPYIVIENGKSRLSQEILDKAKNKLLTWQHLIKMGVIEYLDSEEEENAYVALNADEINERHTHLEPDASTIFGITTNMLPYVEYNSAPRITMACAMAKQSLGIYGSNYLNRYDTRAYIMYYPQQPLVQTDSYRVLNMKNTAAGQNVVIALTSFKGYNMADGIIVNRSSVDRGLGRVVMFRTYEIEERQYPGGQKDTIELPNQNVIGYRGENAYSKLDKDGIVSPGTEVNEYEVLVGKTSPPRFLEEISVFGAIEERKREGSLALKAREQGTVDSVLVTESSSGNRLVKVRIRSIKVPEIGDKIASRHGQKGVIGLMVSQEDMPFTKDGIVPDVIINPHAIPSRMTAGHLLETLGGKASALSGLLMDGTAFSGNREEEYAKILKENGFEEHGEEILYDGTSGKQIKTKLFIGVVYYQRLHHLVSNKIHMRSRGPIQLLTHQPTEGKAREGGLRFGEMERDCLIGYGASMLIKERLLDESDKTIQLVCSECGAIANHDYLKHKDICPVCGNEVTEPIEMSYAFKLLLDEIKSLCLFPRIILRDKA
ncbi:MAG: DNA-directed RNA polymerase subunit B [Candidatus Micrarchaeota archaeon]